MAHAATVVSLGMKSGPPVAPWVPGPTRRQHLKAA